jgi:hypothetical protein
MAFVTRNDFQSSLLQAKAQPVTPSSASRAMETTAAATPPASAARPPVAKQTGTPSVAEYRGTSALANVKPSRNYSTDAAHTSLPFAEVKQTVSAHRQPNDITAHQTNALLTGSGNVFDKGLCSTTKGWKPGKF